MNAIFRTALVTAALALSVPAAANMGDDWDAKKVEVAGPDGTLHKLHRVTAEVTVDATPEEAWELLADFGGVQDYFQSIYESDWIGDPELDEDAARYCKINFQGRDLMVKERIFELTDGESFTYDVYDWTNFPLNRMHNTFGVYVDEMGHTVVYNVIDYKLKPAFLSGMMRGQLRGSAHATMLAMKHVLETGEGDLTRDELEELYPNA